MNLPSCELCKGIFNEETRPPLLLPACGHTLCRSCLLRLTHHRGYVCPSCKKKQPNTPVTSYQTNHALLEIITSLKGLELRERHRSAERWRQEAGEDQCKEHNGVRLAYWCGSCRSPACGECVVDGHLGDQHQVKRINNMWEDQHSLLQDLALEVMSSLNRAEEQYMVSTKASPFMSKAKELQQDIRNVMVKMQMIMVTLATHIQHIKNTNRRLQQLREDLDQLISSIPKFSPGVQGLKALLEHSAQVKQFQDNEVAEALQQVELGKQDDGTGFLHDAASLTRTLDNKVIALAEMIGENCAKEVVVEGPAGMVAFLRWQKHCLHLHCLRQAANPQKPKRAKQKESLKWMAVETQLQGATQVFMDLAWESNKKSVRLYFSLVSDSPFTHHFLELSTGSNNNNSLLGKHLCDMEEVVGSRCVLLGMRCEKTGEAEQGKGEEAEVEKGENKPNTTNPSPPLHPVSIAYDSQCPCDGVSIRLPQDRKHQSVSHWDILSVQGHKSGEVAFWLVIGCGRKGEDTPAAYTRVGTSLWTSTTHTTLLSALLTSKDVHVQDCGALLLQKLSSPA